MMKGYFYPQDKSISSSAAVLGVIFILLSWIVVPLAQGRDRLVKEVQKIESSELKALAVSNLVGLLASPKTGKFFILDRPQVGIQTGDETEIKSFNLDRGTISSSTLLPDGIADPINTSFDKKNSRILGLLADNERLIKVSIDANGVNGQTFSETNISNAVSLRNPQGMTTNPETGVLYILDSGKIVRLEPEENSEELGRTQASEITLPTETGGADEHRGIAFNPSDGLLYVLNPVQQRLYAVTARGVLVLTHDLSNLGFLNSGAIIFAASGDSTDSPERLSLYIADQGINNDSQKIVEVSLRGSVRVQARQASDPTVTATLIQVIDTTRFVNPNPPPSVLASPDPSGITYVPSRDILWIDDGEVEESTGAPSDQYNVFEVNYSSGALVAARSTRLNDPGGADFSNEPVGASAINYVGDNEYMYITDDDPNASGRKIWEVHPGSDRLYGTSDDNPVARVTDFFGSTDPEGIEIGRGAGGQKFLFIADGLDSEIYKINLRGNQRLDGSDPVSSFDTRSAGLRDPEGIAFNKDTGTLFVIGYPAHSLFEFDVNGDFLRKFNLPAAAPLVRPAGLAFAPSSIDSAKMNLYVVDRGVDNDSNPDENDGLILEFDVTADRGGNQDPVAIDDNVTTLQDTVATGNVLDGSLSGGLPDQDPDADSIKVTENTIPSNGTLSSGVTSNGTFTYIPNADFTGSDSFAYTITDGNGGTATAPVNITVSSSRVDPVNPVSPVGGATSVEVGIATSSDDAEEHIEENGSVNTGSGDIDLSRSGGGAQVIGLRFLPSIPQGATIQKAYIQFTADEAGSGNITLSIRGQDVDDAPTFASASGNVSSRAVTSASVSWSPDAWSQGDAGRDQQTANISSIIQEIVNRQGWSRGNGLVVIIKSNDPGDLDKREAKSFDAGNAAKLHVEFNS